MPNNKIQVDLELTLGKLGLGKDIGQAFKKDPKLFKAIAEGLGVSVQDALSLAVQRGVEQGLKRSVPIPHLAAMLNQQLGIGAGQNRPNRSNYEDFWRKTIPPIIPQSLKPQGMLARLESSLMGGKNGGILGGFGRFEVGRAFMNSIGMGGGAAGRLGGVALAGLGQKLPGLTVALAGLSLIIDETKIAFKSLIAAAEEGSKLFILSRQIGTNTSTTASLFNTLGITGIGQGRIGELARFLPQNFNGNPSQMLAASRLSGGSIQEQQQILNMSREIQHVWESTRMDAIATAMAAKPNFSIHAEIEILKKDLETIWGLVSGILEPILFGLARILHTFLQALIFQLSVDLALLQRFGIVPSTTGNPSRIAPFARETHFSSLERMGLVIGGSTDRVYTVLQQIERNTRPSNSKDGYLPNNRMPTAGGQRDPLFPLGNPYGNILNMP